MRLVYTKQQAKEDAREVQKTLKVEDTCTLFLYHIGNGRLSFKIGWYDLGKRLGQMTINSSSLPSLSLAEIEKMLYHACVLDRVIRDFDRYGFVFVYNNEILYSIKKHLEKLAVVISRGRISPRFLENRNTELLKERLVSAVQVGKSYSVEQLYILLMRECVVMAKEYGVILEAGEVLMVLDSFFEFS